MHATLAQAAVMKFGFPSTLAPTTTAGITAMYGLGPIDTFSISDFMEVHGHEPIPDRCIDDLRSDEVQALQEGPHRRHGMVMPAIHSG
jgi:hypothetical protein